MGKVRDRIGGYVDDPDSGERRKSPRNNIDEIAFISVAGGSTRCRIVNASVDGAALEVDNPAYIPNQFQLMTENDRVLRSCRIAWIKGKRIGVEFVDALPINQRERQFMQHLRGGRWIRAGQLPESPKVMENLLKSGLIESGHVEGDKVYRITSAGLAAKTKPVKLRR